MRNETQPDSLSAGSPAEGPSGYRPETEAVSEFATAPGRPGDPCVMVIFGAAGDLTKRKLLPALYNLASDGLLVREFAIVGVARAPLGTEEFRAKLGKEIQEFATGTLEPALWERLESRLYYLQADFRDPAAYQQLRTLLTSVDQDHGTRGNYFYYLATSPEYFGEIIQQLGAADLAEEQDGRWRRVIIEKPFGRDLASARALNRAIGAVLDETQIYRIDHYLGKETVQNILAFRFANGIFEPIWNRRYVDHVQMTVAENVGVELRGHYYEESGALRDMLPNHLFQLISLTAMEPPTSFDADVVRDEQTKVLHAIQPWTDQDVLNLAVRGQYGPGEIDGAPVSGYRTEVNVAADSPIETFVAAKLTIDNWRWADVPFYVRTGKRLPARTTEIVIEFKRPPHLLFRHTAVDHLTPNRLVLRLQPKEGIALTFGAKIPGTVMNLGSVNMDFCYADYFGTHPSTGYERLLYDCMTGDATLFQRADMVEASWSVVTPILDVWQALRPRTFPNYAAGTWGPPEATDLLARDGRHWSLD